MAQAWARRRLSEPVRRGPMVSHISSRLLNAWECAAISWRMRVASVLGRASAWKRPGMVGVAGTALWMGLWTGAGAWAKRLAEATMARRILGMGVPSKMDDPHLTRIGPTGLAP